MKKTAREAEQVLAKVNADLEVVNKVTTKVAEVTDKISSPMIAAASAIFYVITAIKKKRKGCGEE